MVTRTAEVDDGDAGWVAIWSDDYVSRLQIAMKNICIFHRDYLIDDGGEYADFPVQCWVGGVE